MTNRIANLRAKIKARSNELNIQTAHNSTGHWYRFQDQLYPSVTKKLSILKDMGLMNWKMNRSLDYVANQIKYDANKNPKYWLEIETFADFLELAKQVPVKDFESAGDIGTAVHKWREEWMRELIETNISSQNLIKLHGPLDDSRPEVIASCAAITKCIEDLKAQPLACELFLADPKLKLGGTLDDLWAVPIDTKVPDSSLGEGGYKLKRKWEVWLIDLKTSNIGNKNSYYMQVATYWKMFKTLYKIKIDKVFILHTSKTKFGEYDLIPLKHPKRYFQMAKAAYKLYDDLEELEELKRPEIAHV